MKKVYCIVVPPGLPAGEYSAELEDGLADTLIIRPGSQRAPGCTEKATAKQRRDEFARGQEINRRLKEGK
jgi:hypothetical protein